MSRRPERERTPRGDSLAGQRHEVVVGPVAHGGHFVARLASAGDTPGRVVFVRHALPGERVVIEITEGTEGDRFLRGDAVEVREASPDRVAAPCRWSGPGGCGGCDFQHVGLPAQRLLKASVVAEQLRRLAGLDLDVVVEPVPGDHEGLGWRTRMQYLRGPAGGLGLRRHRSHEVVEVDTCLIAAPGAREVVDGVGGEETVTEVVRGRAFEVAADGFWQVHPGAPEALVAAVLSALAPQPGDVALDLYAGVGLFSAFLAEAVGPTGRVVAVEGSREAVANAAGNLADLRQASVVRDRVDRALSRQVAGERADLVVLDPPRVGAKRAVVDAIADLGPRTVAYVACDPAALARDVSYFAERGYRLAGLRAFDLFPMTNHVECVALLTKTGSDLR